MDVGGIGIMMRLHIGRCSLCATSKRHDDDDDERRLNVDEDGVDEEGERGEGISRVASFLCCHPCTAPSYVAVLVLR